MDNFLEKAGERAMEGEASNFLGSNGGNLMNEAKSFLGNNDNNNTNNNMDSNNMDNNTNDQRSQENQGSQQNQGSQENSSNNQQGGKYDQYITKGVDYLDSNVLHRNDSAEVKNKVSVCT